MEGSGWKTTATGQLGIIIILISSWPTFYCCPNGHTQWRDGGRGEERLTIESNLHGESSGETLPEKRKMLWFFGKQGWLNTVGGDSERVIVNLFLGLGGNVLDWLLAYVRPQKGD